MNRRSFPLIALNLAIGLVVAGATGAYATMSSTVELTVEGRTETVRTFGDTVGDVLEARDVTIRPGDEVSLHPDRALRDGDDIEVAFAKPVTLALDGVVTRRTLTATTVDEAFDELGVSVPAGSFVSEARDAKLSRTGNELVVSTPKQVDVWSEGKKYPITTNLPTWAEAVEQAGLTIGPDDEVVTFGKDRELVESADDFVRPDEPVRLIRIEKKSATEEVDVDFATEVQEDPEAMKGEVVVVTQGVKGTNREKVDLVYADGKLRDREVLSTEVVKKPTTQVEKHGTSTTPPDSVWDKIAQCESGGNWSINTGNGYYGGLQFSAATWRSVGGPGLPHQNSREVQIKYAKILQARAGWGQWGCADARFN